MPAEDIAITPQYEEYDEVMHKLDIEGGSTVTIGGIAYNVTFESATHGWFANALPTAEDITMSWESMEESVTPRGEVYSGELYGLARIAAASDANYVYNSDANGAMAFNGAYNGGSETFTKEGTSTVIEYSKALTAERAAEELATGAVYYNGQIMEMAFYKGSFKAADDAGAQYLAVQWLNGEGEENGRPYSATLRNVKIFDADENDLGIQFSSNLKRADVQRMGHEGSTITVRAAEKAGYVLVGWQAQGADGSPADVTFTDNKDGTWSFVMPAEDIAITPQYEDLFASMYALDIEGGSTAKIDGVGYDVSFLYETNGWFANSIPTDGDVTMSWTSIAEEAETRDVGEIYGVARAVTATDANYLFYSGLNGAAGYNGAYNGGAETFTHVGTTTLSYSKELTAERAAQGLATEAVYLNGQLLELAVYPPENPPRSFKAADDAGARYFGVQWINGENVGKTYSATLKNVKIYTPEGEDLGIRFSSGATELSVQRKAEAGKTITVRPDTRSGFAFTGWKATDAEGNAVALTFTDNKDGTWSFTMPAQAIRLESQYEYVMYQLNLEGARTTKIEGVSYDVSFEFAESGWFGNDVPSLEDITMSWTGVSQERAGDLVPGHVYGLVRSVSDVDRQILFNSETAAALRFVYNSTYGTFTDPGADTTIAYSRSLVAGGTENVYYNGSASTYVFNSYGGRTWAAADAAGAQYLAVQWIGGTYKASLSNVKIYDAQGNDLGIQFGEYTLRSSSVQRYGEAGKTLTVAPEIPENYELDFWTVTDAEGNPYELEMTDNGDGTWSFVMPEQGLRIKANFKYTVVESDYYGWYYNIATGSMVQLKEDGVAEITENGQKRNATYAIPYVTELQITDGEETQSYALTVGKFEAEGSVWYRLGTVYVSFETETDAAPARQELKDGNYTAVKPADPVREGYTFGGWYTSDGEEFDFASTVYESVTLHALWIADEEPAAGGCASSAGGPALLASAVLFAGTALIIRRRKEKND